MANKNSAIVQKLMKFFVFVAKLKKPIIRKLVFLKKVKVGEQYSYYGHVKEYEFSPSSTPFIQFRRMRLKKLALLICRCFVGSRKKKEMMPRLDSFQDSLCEDESVDERAERFIQTFYQEMRNESSFQLLLQI